MKARMVKNKKNKKTNTKNKFDKDYLLFQSDENFAFIAGFTSNGFPFGLTHEEMRELENEQKLSESENNDDIDLPF